MIFNIYTLDRALKSQIDATLVIGFCCLPAWAQTNNELSQRSQEQERRAQEILQHQQKNIVAPDVHLQGVTASPVAQRLTAEQPCFPSRELKLQSEFPKQWDWLLAHADGHTTLDKPDPVEGNCLGAQGVQVVIDRLQNALIAQGYVTSRVLASPQNMQAGLLNLKLFLGRIREVKWAQGSGQRGSRWNTVPMDKGDALNLRDIEQALENY